MKCEFHVGDRVLSIGATPDGHRVKDLVGTVCTFSEFRPRIGVRWDKSLDFMHSCSRNCDDGHGWYVEENDLVLIPDMCDEDTDFEMGGIL